MDLVEGKVARPESQVPLAATVTAPVRHKYTMALLAVQYYDNAQTRLLATFTRCFPALFLTTNSEEVVNDPVDKTWTSILLR